jgi:hypothetical protein
VVIGTDCIGSCKSNSYDHDSPGVRIKQNPQNYRFVKLSHLSILRFLIGKSLDLFLQNVQIVELAAKSFFFDMCHYGESYVFYRHTILIPQNYTQTAINY